MATNNHTPVTTNAPANASVVNSPLGQLDAAIGDRSSFTGTPSLASLLGGILTAAGVLENNLIGFANRKLNAVVENQQLIEWANSGAYEVLTQPPSGMYTVGAAATVKWPDGSAGVMTITGVNNTWSIPDAYTITHTDSGKTVTQNTVTINSNGTVETIPPLTVA